MFRLANNAFKEEKKLQELATFVVTETIRAYLMDYFMSMNEFIPENELYRFVDIRKVRRILPNKLLNEMDGLDIDTNRFLRKKVAQMLNELNSKTAHTFDVFNEYLLAKMIKYAYLNEVEYRIDEVEEVMEELEERLFNYIENYREDDDWEEPPGSVSSMLEGLTDFHSFLIGDEENFVFWDADYTFIDDWGMNGFLWACSIGIMDVRGYSAEYIKDIFLSVGEPFPKNIKRPEVA